MSFDGEERPWMCGGAGVVNLHRVSSIVREIREPCLHQSPKKASKMLKRDKWLATFDDDGKICGFQKVLKLIVLGGVEPSIRAQVWEFLLGCYAAGSTAEYRQQLRMARRERYNDLIKECQRMHSSIGTGSLAYVVGSKVMDARTMSRDNTNIEIDVQNGQVSHDAPTETEASCQRESSSDSTDLVSVRQSTDSAAYDSSNFAASAGPYDCFSSKSGREVSGSEDLTSSYFDFPPLPVTNLFRKSHADEQGLAVYEDRISTEQTLGLEDEPMHSFQINNNIDLIMESKVLPSIDTPRASGCETENFKLGIQDQVIGSKCMESQAETVNRLRISDIPHASMINATTSTEVTANDGRVAEWLWTLHRIVVDVVRTDSHLNFYEDAKNMARMSDILAVYAWVDPATGYCQGMSDLLSPFIVLYEDNADAFWCFEMLLRRTRQNFQMDGPTGVMKQLQALGRILELTDIEMFTHLSLIGADSLLFAFRMLLVLFRRELSFNDALRMWEMMWAADFDESTARMLEDNCLEPLVLQLPSDWDAETTIESEDSGKKDSKGSKYEHSNVEQSASHDVGVRSVSIHPFCGLTTGSFWMRHNHKRFQNGTLISSTGNGDDELSVFCVAAILIINRPKIIKGTHSMDDLIKMFNDTQLQIHVKRCVRMAIKLRKKYFYKVIKHTSRGAQSGD